MAASTDQLIALKNDGKFRERARNLIRQICSQIYSEDGATANHGTRSAYAVKLIQGIASMEGVIDTLVTRTNLVGSAVTYNFADGQILTDASDAAILSQLATDWNFLAGV